MPALLVAQEVFPARAPNAPPPPREVLDRRNAPPVQNINQCEFTGFYLDLAREMNKMRYGEDEILKLCMNRKLMWAAKIQSDFQALLGEPTHSGPRMVKLGSVEERVDASHFHQVSGLAAPEEIIYYWPQFPKEAYGKDRRKALRTALLEIRKDKAASATLDNGAYRFFGAALTRKPNGQAFMTIVVADSRREQCHTCDKLADGSRPFVRRRAPLVMPVAASPAPAPVLAAGGVPLQY